MPSPVERPPRPTSKTVGVWMWHVQTDIIQADAGVCDYFSVLPSEGETGLPLEAFLAGIHDEDRPRIVSCISRAVMSGEPFHEVYRVKHRLDGIRWIEAKGTCFRDANGRPSTYPGTIVDVTNDARMHPHSEIVENLMEAHDLAEFAQEPLLARLIEAVLLEAGMRLASNLNDNDSL